MSLPIIFIISNNKKWLVIGNWTNLHNNNYYTPMQHEPCQSLVLRQHLKKQIESAFEILSPQI